MALTLANPPLNAQSLGLHLCTLRILAAAILLVMPLDAGACSWSWTLKDGTPTLADGSPAPTPDEFRDAKHPVVLGTVVRLESPDATCEWATSTCLCGTRAHILVERFWGSKVLPASVQVETPRCGGGCGIRFEVGKKYLLFAELSDGTLKASIVGRSGLFDPDSELWQHMKLVAGPGREPGPPSDGERPNPAWQPPGGAPAAER